MNGKDSNWIKVLVQIAFCLLCYFLKDIIYFRPLMIKFSEPHISIANQLNSTAIKILLNSAYRGEASKKGWTTEAHLIAGDIRTDDATIKQIIQQSGSVFLIYRNDSNAIIGCVNLQKHDNKIYLSMFSVSPTEQSKNIGKKLLHAAEEYARYLQCNAIYMSVISLRTELISWYLRHNYKDTGVRTAFIEDGITGKHMQPLTFMTLEKSLV